MARDWTDTFFTGAWETLIRNAYTEEESREQSRFIRRALKLRERGRVADIPCGDGRISFELARAGCRVVGVDRSAASVRRARARARKLGLKADFSVGDMRDLKLAGPFDGIVNWWGSFGYFSDETNLAVLRRFAELLAPGGRVLVDQVNRERILRKFMHRNEATYGSVRVLIRNTWNPERQSVDGTWTMIRGGNRKRCHSSIRMYTPKETERMLTRAGFRLERLYGDVDGTEYRRGSRRMISVAVRR